MARWWFRIFLIFTPNLGENSRFDSYFSNRLKPLPRWTVFDDFGSAHGGKKQKFEIRSIRNMFDGSVLLL